MPVEDDDTCLDSNAATPHASAARAIAPGTRIGRYVIVQTLGEGGMGIVYRARDPELGRPIALKMLRAELASRSGSAEDATTLHDRLAREARAMAQLSHPNVVGVYDLIVDDGVLFIAMEFIEGTSLASWLTLAPRRWSDVLRVFRHAGDGLAAAHAAGLVHRDFKPDNVLIDEAHGRVCVTDFGIARLGVAPEGPDAILASLTSPAPGRALTKAGALTGTPAYMSPEQYRGDVTTARTDQFSFCVALHEALHRESPFQGDTVHARAAAVMTGSRRPRPKDDVPARIDRVLERGMRVDPADRYASMTALLRALSVSPAKHLRYAAAACAILAVAVGATMFVRKKQVQAATTAAACPSADQRLSGVWDSTRKEKIRQAFESTNKPYALDAWRGTERRIDAYTHDWSTMYVSSCSGRSVDVTQLRRGLCLEERLIDLRALVDVLERADAALVTQAVPAAESLTRVARCSENASAPPRVAPPDNPQMLAKVASVRERLAHIRALHDTQSWKTAMPLVEPALVEARASGYRPVVAEALLAFGTAYAAVHNREKAAGALREAAAIADAVGDDRTRAFALVKLVRAVEPATPEGKVVVAQAVAAAERVAGDDEVQYQLQMAVGVSHVWSAVRYVEAEGAFRKALDAARRAYGEESWRAATALNAIGAIAGETGRSEEGLALNERAVYMFRQTIGPEAPGIVILHYVSAELLTEMLRPAEAEPHLREGLRVAERELDRENPVLTEVLDSLGRALADEGKYQEALRVHERALPLREKRGHPEAMMITLLGLGRAHLGMRAPLKAIPPLDRAVRTEHAADRAMVHAQAELELADALRRVKRSPSRVRELLTHARDAYRAAGRTARRERDLARIEALLAAP